MSGQHTQGRLVVRNLWLVPEAHSDRLIGGASDPERDFDDYAHFIGSAEGKRNYHNNEANARRLAACWNACEGMSIEHIEALQGIGTMGDLSAMATGELVDMRKELAAARALLQKEMQAHEENNRFESAERIRSFLEGK